MKLHGFRPLPVLAFFIMSICISGCSNNIRTYEKGNVVAQGSILSSNDACFFNLEVGNPSAPASERNLFSIELKNGKRMLTSNIAKEDIAPISSYMNKEMKWGDMVAELYCVDDFIFVFYGGRLVSIRAKSSAQAAKEPSLKISNQEMNRFYEMPLTQMQLVDVFGAPDKMYDSHVN